MKKGIITITSLALSFSIFTTACSSSNDEAKDPVVQSRTDGLTQEIVIDLGEKILETGAEGFKYEDSQVSIAFRDYIESNLSSESYEVMLTLEEEILERGISAFELAERWDELNTPKTHTKWSTYSNELDALFNLLPAATEVASINGGTESIKFRKKSKPKISPYLFPLWCAAEVLSCRSNVKDYVQMCKTTSCDPATEYFDASVCSDCASSNSYSCWVCGSPSASSCNNPCKPKTSPPPP